LHHGETGEDRSCNKVGREDGRVPTGDDRGGEVHGYDGVYGKYQGGRQTGHYQGYFLKALLSFGLAAPTKGEDSVDVLLHWIDRTVANHRKIRN